MKSRISGWKWGKIMHVRTLAGSRYADRNPMTNNIVGEEREKEKERDDSFR